ncbi:hypothetical protein [Paracoccus sp. T5]|uniref:hypothetical protein n=1 Tax=Paracoccus sp. T5 TaxID=3402161 RepID=UPI003ADAAEEF
MAIPHADRGAKPQAVPARVVKPLRSETAPRPEAKPKPAAISRANEIVRAIGLRPITGLSGPKIGY